MTWSFIIHVSQYILFFICALSVPLSPICWSSVRRQKAHFTAILRDGVRTNGIITKRSLGKFHWYLTFSYKDQGKEYIQRQSVSQTAYGKIHEGAVVSVAYLPDNPQESAIVDIETYLFIRSLAIACTIASVIFIIGLIAGIFSIVIIGVY